MALLEAYASGTPVVASRLGSLDELVIENETGRKFEAGNADSLAQTALKLLADPAQLSRLGNRAHEVYVQHYSAERNYEILMQIYRDAIEDFNQSRLKEKRA